MRHRLYSENDGFVLPTWASCGWNAAASESIVREINGQQCWENKELVVWSINNITFATNDLHRSRQRSRRNFIFIIIYYYCCYFKLSVRFPVWKCYVRVCMCISRLHSLMCMTFTFKFTFIGTARHTYYYTFTLSVCSCPGTYACTFLPHDR